MEKRKKLNYQKTKYTSGSKRRRYEPYLNTVHLDDVQMQTIIDALGQSVSEASNKTIEELSKVLNNAYGDGERQLVR